MGLLDDAIREHLELKRLRGADPSEMAREERAVLDPVPTGEGPEPAELPVDEGEAASSVNSHPTGTDDMPEPELSDPLQETAEIDMGTILETVESDHRVHPGRRQATRPA